MNLLKPTKVIVLLDHTKEESKREIDLDVELYM